jgi:hypothetical protein
MDSILISSGLSLLALTGGMFLLAKSNKDMLSMFFKLVAYFIIIVSFLNLACTALHGVMRIYGKHYFYNRMRDHEKFREGPIGHHYDDYYMGRYDRRNDWREDRNGYSWERDTTDRMR